MTGELEQEEGVGTREFTLNVIDKRKRSNVFPLYNKLQLVADSIVTFKNIVSDSCAKKTA